MCLLCRLLFELCCESFKLPEFKVPPTLESISTEGAAGREEEMGVPSDERKYNLSHYVENIPILRICQDPMERAVRY